MLFVSRRLLVVASLVLACACGCSSGNQPDLAPVRGTITLDGQPLYPARIVFIPPEGRASSARTNEAGEFELLYLRDIHGAALGKHTVRITNGTGDPPQNTLPPEYNERSKLSATVEPGENQFDFALTPSN